jgi:hypothetical protein
MSWEHWLPGAVDAGLMDKRCAGFSGEHLPLLLVHAHVRVQALTHIRNTLGKSSYEQGYKV